MPTQATLKYQIAPQGPVSLNALLAAAQPGVLPLPTGDMANFGATVFSDAAAINGGNVERTIVFHFQAAFYTNFPNGTDQASPFRGLYTQILAYKLVSAVVEVPVVLA
jgi:hypothetical protein